jgi:VanZ family protein
MRTLLKYWVPVFIWLGVVFAGSTDIFSAEQTSRYLVPFLRWLNPQISPSTIAMVHFALRKLSHLTEYAILAAFLWRALCNGTNLGAKVSFLFIAVWFVCGICAVTDEFHQSFVASRTASPHDVLIDVCGALIGILLCLMFWRRSVDKK